MKLFCKDEMQRLEQAAAQTGTSLGTMMERAGAAVADEVEKRCRPIQGRRVVVLCGKGNNGGDGFVCAGEFFRRGAVCTVVLVQGEPQTGLAKEAFARLPEEIPCLKLPGDRQAAERAIRQAEALVDCVFGFSFRGELPREAGELLALCNQQDCLRVAADLPSGAECDTGRAGGETFRAQATVTFTGKKPANCSYPAKEYCGETVVRQVGVPAALAEEAQTRMFELDESFPGRWLPRPDVQCNKGSQGKLLLVCGSYGMAGACIMAARAALRCGVGLVQVAVEKELYPILAQAVPEAVFLILDLEAGRGAWEPKLLAALNGCSACLIGCGLGGLSETLCPVVLAHCEKPLVVDADGLNFCAKHPEVFEGAQGALGPYPPPGGDGPAVRGQHSGDPVGPAGGRQDQGPGDRGRGGPERGGYHHRRAGRPLCHKPHGEPRHGQGRQRRRAGGDGGLPAGPGGAPLPGRGPGGVPPRVRRGPVRGGPVPAGYAAHGPDRNAAPSVPVLYRTVKI